MALLSTAGGVFLSLLFLSAAAHKMASPVRFAATLEAQDIVPAWARGGMTYALPLVELAIAAGLFLPAARSFAAMAAAVLLALYGAGMAVNLIRGRRALDCGCSFLTERTLSPALLWRNGGLVLLAGLVAATPVGAAVGGVAWWNAAAAGLVVFLIYLALEALAVTAGRISEMRAR